MTYKRQVRCDEIKAAVLSAGVKLTDKEIQKIYNYNVSLGSKYRHYSELTDNDEYWDEHWQRAHEAEMVAARKWDPNRKASIVTYIYGGLQYDLLSSLRNKLVRKLVDVEITQEFLFDFLHAAGCSLDVQGRHLFRTLTGENKININKLLVCMGLNVRLESDTIDISLTAEGAIMHASVSCMASMTDDSALEHNPADDDEDDLAKHKRRKIGNTIRRIAVANLDYPHRYVLLARTRLIDERIIPYDEIARTLSRTIKATITEQRVRQIEKEAIEILNSIFGSEVKVMAA